MDAHTKLNIAAGEFIFGFNHDAPDVVAERRIKYLSLLVLEGSDKSFKGADIRRYRREAFDSNLTDESGHVTKENKELLRAYLTAEGYDNILNEVRESLASAKEQRENLTSSGHNVR